MSLKVVVMIIVTLIIIFSLMMILAKTYGVLFAEKKTASDAAFNRFSAELDEVIASETPMTISVPLLAEEMYFIVVFKESDPELPASCRGHSCVCLFQREGESFKEKCKVYEDIESCTEECGDEPCLAQSIRIPAKKSMTISRDYCNRLSFA